MTKILGSVWYTQMGGPLIGIVVINNGYEEKAYIGNGHGAHITEDAQHIAEVGASFPLDVANKLIGR